ncbi:ABC transporter ATP-binding protein [Nocardia colli]|uniref:ABC transporter ATP-binding protein n=1 Tax=Nocardia colli TaxID=2545717 RepID=UPI001CC38727|nr:ABC transporter ATP-binding protein [Nocardia colli]
MISQPRRVLLGATLGSLWMVALTVPPYLLSRAIDDGLAKNDLAALTGWVAALFGIGVVNAALSIARHRTMSKVRMEASFQTVSTTVEHCVRLGADLSRRITAGEIVAIGSGDVQVIAQSLTVTGPGVGAAVGYVVIAVVMFSISPLLAVVVLAGVPILALTVGPLLHRIERAGAGHREQQGTLTTRLVDVFNGLPVLNGLGGKSVYAARYQSDSQALVIQGYRVGVATSWVDALGRGLPAAFLAVVIWLGARMAAEGSISVGSLVAVYGYTAMLVVPVSFFIEAAGDIARARVAARRVTGLLSISPDSSTESGTVDAPPAASMLRDPASGVEVRPGLSTALVGDNPAESAAVIDRLGGFTKSDVTWGDVRVDIVFADQLRRRILVADNDAYLFTGSVRDVVAGRHAPDDGRIRDALHVAVATDVVDALPDGLASTITPRGGNLSGGQRQRLRLARAVYAEPELLLAVEPTSAVDAHTEAAIATRLRAARRGRTTVVASTSPLVLDHVDTVIYLVDGVVAATGTHHDLLQAEPGYRALVSRGTDEGAHR